jgi:hypothetical protein
MRGLQIAEKRSRIKLVPFDFRVVVTSAAAEDAAAECVRPDAYLQSQQTAQISPILTSDKESRAEIPSTS